MFPLHRCLHRKPQPAAEETLRGEEEPEQELPPTHIDYSENPVINKSTRSGRKVVFNERNDFFYY